MRLNRPEKESWQEDWWAEKEWTARLGARTKNGWHAANGRASSARAKPNSGVAVAEGSCLRTLGAGSHFCLERQRDTKPPDLRRAVLPGPLRPTLLRRALQHIKNNALSSTRNLRKGIGRGENAHTVAHSTPVPAVSTARVGARGVRFAPCSQGVACRPVGGRASGLASRPGVVSGSAQGRAIG
jgi:hypothetical protein